MTSKLYKNPMGDGSKLWADDILILGGITVNEAVTPIASQSGEHISTWLLGRVKSGTSGTFYPSNLAIGLPVDNENWRLSTGWYHRRSETIMHFMLIAQNGQIATRAYTNGTWSVYRLIG